jgi:cytochrome c553
MTRNEGPGVRAMKVISLRLVLQTTVFAVVVAAADSSDGAGTAASSRRDVQGKIEYCMDCHGPSGQGYRGFLTMPRLAGQTTSYLESQLRAFLEGTRGKNLFIRMARVHGLNPVTRAALAARFRELNPPPFGGAPRQLAAAGARIYEEGIPEGNVPACSACHGPEAQGQDEIPRLAGQLFSYTAKTLSNWGKERGQNLASAVMVPIARNLTQSQIAAIAAYVSYLK